LWRRPKRLRWFSGWTTSSKLRQGSAHATIELRTRLLPNDIWKAAHMRSILCSTVAARQHFMQYPPLYPFNYWWHHSNFMAANLDLLFIFRRTRYPFHI
jgi:hypothetical protein